MVVVHADVPGVSGIIPAVLDECDVVLQAVAAGLGPDVADGDQSGVARDIAQHVAASGDAASAERARHRQHDDHDDRHQGRGASASDGERLARDAEPAAGRSALGLGLLLGSFVGCHCGIPPVSDGVSRLDLTGLSTMTGAPTAATKPSARRPEMSSTSVVENARISWLN